MGIFMMILSYVPEAVMAASVLTALTPTPKDDKIVGKAYKVLEIIGLNVGKAKQVAAKAKKK